MPPHVDTAGRDPKFFTRRLYAQYKPMALKMHRLVEAVMIEAHKEIDGTSRRQKLIGHEIDGRTADVPGHPPAV